ncbi:hypothetical protein NCS55_01469700 [Fusarium keratoplasticum]|nr:hypothetical protein NCS55_01469700 [Fusarium keratoplasticum]
MHFSYILSFIAFGLGAANAAAIDDDNMFDARSTCPQGIELIQLKLKHGKLFTGVGKPGKCYNLPKNINNFDVYSDDSKSLVRCFNCKVYTQKNCQGTYVTLQGEEERAQSKSTKRPTYKSWQCDCGEDRD